MATSNTSITYSNFGISQDDVLPGGSFVDGRNIDGTFDGNGARLGPKINKGILTTYPIRAIGGEARSDGAETDLISGGDNGEIYKLNGTDFTPLYTLTGGYNIALIVRGNSYYYIFYRNGNSLDVCRLRTGEVQTGTILNPEETFMVDVITQFSSSAYTAPYLSVGGDFILLGGVSTKFYLVNLDAGTATAYTFNSDIVVGFTRQGSTYVVYCRDGNAFLWDGASLNQAASQYVGARISRVTQKSGVDYITTEDGMMYVGQGLSFQRITKPRKSNRLEDNSSFQDVMDFGPATTELFGQARYITVAQDDMYCFSNDGVKGIYKYGEVLPGTQEQFSKIICDNYAGTQLDVVYDIWYYERTLKRVYFAYKAGSTYGVDYFDLESLESTTNGYLITDAYNANASYKKLTNQIRLATGYTNGSNSIELYYRVNNGAWELIRTVNEDENPVDYINALEKANGASMKQYGDRQYKIVFTNGNANEKTPVLKSLTESLSILNV